MNYKQYSARCTGLAAFLCTVLAVLASEASAQPREVERVSVRAELAIEESLRRVARDGWTVRNNGPWLRVNDQWTNAAGLTTFPANTEYWVVALVDECVGCQFDLRFFDEDAGGYFSMKQILKVESDGSLVTAKGRFAVERDTRGELYLQMKDGSELYATYLILAQIR